MNRTELLAALEHAGLSPYQSDAFVTILEFGSAPAIKIAKNSSVPDPRIYDVLRDLEQRGYIETYEQDSLHARAHSPMKVLSDLRSRSHQFEKAAKEIENRWQQPDLTEHSISIVKRTETALERAESLIRSAKTQVQLAVTRSQYDRLADALETARENGVAVQLCLYPGIHREVDPPSLEELSRTCSEARLRDVPSPFLVLVDRSWTCFSPQTNSGEQYSVIVNNRNHTYVFHWFFLACLWEIHETVYKTEQDELPVTYVDLRECVREIIPLLDAGEMIEATVTGYTTTEGVPVRHTGHIIGVDCPQYSSDNTAETALYSLAGKVTIMLETDEATVTIGGLGAVVEDVEMTTVTIESVS